MSSSKISLFERFDFDFKRVHGHEIKVSILIPKTLQTRPRKACPTMVNWHGGGLIVGDRLYEGWLPAWLLETCLAENVIFIAPDYRLLPEASIEEILEDVRDFWIWLHHELPLLTRSWNAIPDLDRLICTGQSAGGLLAVQSALLFPDLVNIKCIASMGGSLNTDIPYCRVPGPRLILGKRPPPAREAEKIVRTYLRNIKPQTVRTNGNVMEMWSFLTCVLQQAYLARWVGIKGREDFGVMNLLDRDRSMPPIWLIHGQQDSVVPPLCSTSFVEKLQSRHPDVPVLLNLCPGDHGFEVKHDRREPWIEDGVMFMKQHWL